MESVCWKNGIKVIILGLVIGLSSACGVLVDESTLESIENSGNNPINGGIKIHGIVPNQGEVLGGQEISISGEGFVAGIQVSVGASPCTTVTFISPILVRCVVPSHVSGYVDVKVLLPNGKGDTKSDGFFYKPFLAQVQINQGGGISTSNGITIVDSISFSSDDSFAKSLTY